MENAHWNDRQPVQVEVCDAGCEDRSGCGAWLPVSSFVGARCARGVCEERECDGDEKGTEGGCECREGEGAEGGHARRVEGERVQSQCQPEQFSERVRARRRVSGSKLMTAGRGGVKGEREEWLRWSSAHAQYNHYNLLSTANTHERTRWHAIDCRAPFTLLLLDPRAPPSPPSSPDCWTAYNSAEEQSTTPEHTHTRRQTAPSPPPRRSPSLFRSRPTSTPSHLDASPHSHTRTLPVPRKEQPTSPPTRRRVFLEPLAASGE